MPTIKPIVVIALSFLIAAICTTIALAGRYVDDASVFWNIANGQIYLSDPNATFTCIETQNTGTWFGSWLACGGSIPLIYVLVLCLLAIAGALWFAWRASKIEIKAHLANWPRKTTVIGGLVLIGLVLVSAGVFFFTHGSVEECIVSEMRGQQQYMIGAVQRLCAKRFRQEIEIPTSALKITFDTFGSPPTPTAPDLYQMIDVSVEKSTDYLPTKGKFRFAGKDCKDASANDFTVEKTLAYEPQIGGFSFKYGGVEYLQCMRTDTVWGIYR